MTCPTLPRAAVGLLAIHDVMNASAQETWMRLYTVYTPLTIKDSMLYGHLDDIESYVGSLGAPLTDSKQILGPAQ